MSWSEESEFSVAQGGLAKQLEEVRKADSEEMLTSSCSYNSNALASNH